MVSGKHDAGRKGAIRKIVRHRDGSLVRAVPSLASLYRSYMCHIPCSDSSRVFSYSTSLQPTLHAELVFFLLLLVLWCWCLAPDIDKCPVGVPGTKNGHLFIWMGHRKIHPTNLGLKGVYILVTFLPNSIVPIVKAELLFYTI